MDSTKRFAKVPSRKVRSPATLSGAGLLLRGAVMYALACQMHHGHICRPLSLLYMENLTGDGKEHHSVDRDHTDEVRKFLIHCWPFHSDPWPLRAVRLAALIMYGK